MLTSSSPWSLKVSVLMITYNQKPYVAQAIESALNQQTCFDYEIVIGDDCSKDGTSDIVAQFARDYPDKIRTLPNEINLGAHKNLLRTWKACRGQYVAILEGDDYWNDPQKLSKQTDFLDRSRECSLCFHKATVLGPEGPKNAVPTGISQFSDVTDILRDNFIPTASTMFRNGLITEPPAWLHELAFSDWPLHVLHAVHGQLGFLDEVMATYRVHSGGVWSQRPATEMLIAKIPFYRYIDAELGFRHHALISELLYGIFSSLAQTAWDLAEYDKARQYAWESLRLLPLPQRVGRLRFMARFVWPGAFCALRTGWRAVTRRAGKKSSQALAATEGARE